MSTQDRFADLWTDYLEGELDENGFAKLRELLAADESLVGRAADLLQTHRLLGLVVAEKPARQDEFVRETLAMLPERQDEFIRNVMARVEYATSSSHSDARSRKIGRIALRVLSVRALAAAALILVAIGLFSFRPTGTTPLADDGDHREGTVMENHVRLASSSHAKFFGELSPPVGSTLPPQREYVLMSGLVEIAFPAGASAILEGPAVFRVRSNASLALDVGRCSVHAPEGAEGFHVETPVTRVVDRGTRFTVCVGETSETEVQVIEGAADIYGRSNGVDVQPQSEVRLTDGEARKFSSGTNADDALLFDASVYRRQLPDRVVSYKASQAADGGAENLTSVTVQRGGKVVEIPVGELIAARITWFKADEPRAFLCGGATLPESRASTLFDHSLVTGVINPDGSHKPLAADPVIEGESGTPGMAIRFDRPVVNGRGADVVFFDLQTYANPPDGDAFHVSPLTFRDGLRSHTIRKYDLTMESPEALDLTSFHVYLFKDAVESVAQLESLTCSPQKQSNQFRGLAVGVDLSDLGYAAGETVEGLFFQDALDDVHHVDPVLITGLPEMK